jgi:hypothetical protein
LRESFLRAMILSTTEAIGFLTRAVVIRTLVPVLFSEQGSP